MSTLSHDECVKHWSCGEKKKAWGKKQWKLKSLEISNPFHIPVECAICLPQQPSIAKQITSILMKNTWHQVQNTIHHQTWPEPAERDCDWLGQCFSAPGGAISQQCPRVWGHPVQTDNPGHQMLHFLAGSWDNQDCRHRTSGNIIFLFIHASGPYYPNMTRWELEVILSLVYKMILLILALELANMTKWSPRGVVGRAYVPAFGLHSGPPSSLPSGFILSY